MTSKHTQGPWQVSGVRARELKLGRDTQLHMVGPDGDEAAAVFYCTKTGRGVADAKLIAAAPDLLAALEALMDVASDCGVSKHNFAMGDARAAIEKAVHP